MKNLPIQPLEMTKLGQESKRDGSRIVGTVPPKSGQLATMVSMLALLVLYVCELCS